MKESKSIWHGANTVICASKDFYKSAEWWDRYFSKIERNSVKSIVSIDTTDKECYLDKYMNVHKRHYTNIKECEVLFIINKTKNAIKNYIGSSVFAEIAFAIGLNIIYDKSIKIYLLNQIPNNMPYTNELKLWKSAGWISIFKECFPHHLLKNHTLTSDDFLNGMFMKMNDYGIPVPDEELNGQR